MWQQQQKHRDGGGEWRGQVLNNFDFIFLKAGEEWTTIAKTKGKKKTKPEDEWQEVNIFTPPMKWSAAF